MSESPGRWPAGFRSALIVSIDVDGAYGEANHHGANDFFWRSQTEYDVATGVWRLIQLLDDRSVAGTFCWVGRCVEDRPDAVARAHASGHESAIHSWDHRYYTPMSLDEQLDDMRRTISAIENVTGIRPVGHKTPAWRYNDDTARAVQQLGLTWQMDIARADLPWVERPDPVGSPVVQLPPSRFYDDYTYFVDWTVNPRHAAEFWRDDLDVLRDEGKLLCLTLHPWVSGRPGPSRALANLLDYAIDLGDIWIARADQVARWWLERGGE
ncbi:MAG TPA: polysaccharide deacetylase family protein [Thermomicrobiales bacterium]|nr:polysaccharide deacetylase family protein [Thermomicrobiales bacterium]HRA30938.1 polysaccharide deacetylase family protein [Thermomicrobiales bacterium]